MKKIHVSFVVAVLASGTLSHASTSECVNFRGVYRMECRDTAGNVNNGNMQIPVQVFEQWGCDRVHLGETVLAGESTTDHLSIRGQGKYSQIDLSGVTSWSEGKTQITSVREWQDVSSGQTTKGLVTYSKDGENVHVVYEWQGSPTITCVGTPVSY